MPDASCWRPERRKYKFPFVYSDVEYVLAGGLMALGPGHYEGYHRAAKYVDEILRGANPADLPIAGPTQFTLSANRTAFEKLGLQPVSWQDTRPDDRSGRARRRPPRR
jgi:ABC-type uncharacterized transport system substrate-binding protein